MFHVRNVPNAVKNFFQWQLWKKLRNWANRQKRLSVKLWLLIMTKRREYNQGGMKDSAFFHSLFFHSALPPSAVSRVALRRIASLAPWHAMSYSYNLGWLIYPVQGVFILKTVWRQRAFLLDFMGFFRRFRVRVPSRALVNEAEMLINTAFPRF